MSWQKVKLGDVASFVNGYAFKPSDWSQAGMEIIRIQNLTKSSGESNYFLGKLDERYKVIKGDILISWSATLGVYEWFGTDAWLNQHIFKVVFDKEEVDKRFFKYMISHVLNDLKQQVHGATMKHITKDKFDNTLVPLPPLNVQKKIADILNKADVLRRKDAELIKKYDELAQSIFIDTFGDPVTNPKGWEIEQIGSSLDFMTSGSRGWAQYYTDNGDIFLRINNVGYNKLKLDDIVYVDAPNSAESTRTQVVSGDIVLSITADLGRTAVIPSDFPRAFISQHLALLRVKKGFNSFFISQVLSSDLGKIQFKSLTKGGVKAGLNFDDIRSLSFINPPLALQDLFMHKVNILSQQLNISKNVLDNSEQLFQSLLQRAFNGELVH